MRTGKAHYPDTVRTEATDESIANERPLQPIHSIDISDNDFVTRKLNR